MEQVSTSFDDLTYGALCSLYYDLDVSKNTKEEFDFYEHYVKKTKGYILEPMCGSGRFLLPFLESGYAIEGFDASHAMLQRLRERAQNQKIVPVVWHGLVQDFVSIKKYDLIFIPCGSFNLIFNMQDAQNALLALYASLSDGGILIFEVMTAEFLKNQEVSAWFYNAIACPDGKIITLATMHEPADGFVQKTICRYDLLEGNMHIKTEDEIYTLRFYTQSIMNHMLQATGFKHIRCLKAFDHQVLAADDDGIIIYECTK